MNEKTGATQEINDVIEQYQNTYIDLHTLTHIFIRSGLFDDPMTPTQEALFDEIERHSVMDLRILVKEVVESVMKLADEKRNNL